jgi:hypothetical protein
MLRSTVPLATAQLARRTPLEIAEATAPGREALLEVWRRRNAVLDALFYDVSVISAAEAATLSPWLAREGMLLIVPPRGKGSVELCNGVDAFLAKGGASVTILAVAGVGSSALGAAAFARNVAEAFDEPVVAVVSGYGLADLLTEAAGGWFFFRTLNGIRHEFEAFDSVGRWVEPEAVTDRALANISTDVSTLRALLSEKRCSFRLLTGHSKGNLILSEALSGEPRFAAVELDAWIVTVSAAIYMPSRYRRIVDVIGDIDWFGAMNSQRGVDIELRQPLAFHHTNTELPYHLPVECVFRRLQKDYGVGV